MTTRTLPAVLLVALQFAHAPAACGQDLQPPSITIRSPLPGAIGQSVSGNVTVIFSEPVHQPSISIVLRNSANTIVSSTTAYDPPSQTVVLDPVADMTASRTYTVTVSGVQDLAGNTMATAVWSFSTGVPGFREVTVFSGLENPTAFQFAADGRVFVAQKNGLILVFDSLTATTPTVFADLRTKVHNFGNRGLLGLALDPAFPARPYAYVFYTYDAPIGGAAPTWGTVGASTDGCPDPAGGCVVSGRISRLQASGNVLTGTEQVLVEDWYQKYPGQSVGNLAFGPDGNLYAGAGDGAASTFVDLGQTDSPSPDPANEGGALRSQDLRTPADQVTLDGTVIRIAPDSGQPVRSTTSMTVGAPTTDANGVKRYSVVSTFQGSQQMTVRVLEPTNPAPGRPRRVLYVLPVETGVTSLSSAYSDGLEELRLLNAHNRFNLTLIAPSFNYEPWYGDHATNPARWMETFIVHELVPFGDSFAAGGAIPQRFVLGFSKSGNGALLLILRHPNVFSAAAAWDAPAQFTDMTAFQDMALNFGNEANFDSYEIPRLVTSNGAPFKQTNRIWISGDTSAWTSHMVQLRSQLIAASIPHTWGTGAVRQHSWSSGWLDAAVTALDATAQTALVSSNEQRIVAYGLRSPRVAFRPATQEIWVADKGKSAEEINRISSGSDGVVENFGWPCYQGAATTEYSGAGICSQLYSLTGRVTAPYYVYDHQEKVSGGDESAGGSAISGLAFYDTGNYPAEYQGALFFSDYLRNQIWVMFKGSGGLPSPASRSTFLLGAASPMDLKTGPGGDLFYADWSGGTIRRIQYSAPVIRTGGQPSGVLPAGTTQTVLSLTTTANATCRYATSPGIAYASMGNAFAATGGTVHSSLITGLGGGGNYSYYVRCQDAGGNANTDDFLIAFSVAQPGDTTPPVRSNGAPVGTLAAGTTQTTISLTTNENSACRYATSSGIAYASMGNAFTTTGATSHSMPVTGLANGGSYTYYVRCQDTAGNPNTNDFTIAFSVAQNAVVSSTFSGVENPLSEGGVWSKPRSWNALRKNNGAYATGQNAQARLVSPTIGAEQYAEITYSQEPGSSSWVGVATRVQGASNGSGYLAIAYAGEARLYRTDDTGSLNFTLLASTPIAIGTAPRRLRLESQGSVHRVYFNGVQVVSFAGTPYPSGQPGVSASVFGGPTVKILSFEGGALGASDTTPPVRSNGAPTGALAAGTTQTTISLATNENAACRYASSPGVAYASMGNAFATTGATSHFTLVTGLSNGSSYNYYARCQDTAGNPNADDFAIAFSIAQPSDTTPPVRSNGAPTGTLAAGTTQTAISLATNENAACRYASSPGVAYASMGNAFATTGATSHSTLVTGLSNASSYAFYVRCQDTAGNPNPDDFSIAFSIAQPSDTTPPVRSNGSPTGTLAAGTTQATISLTTNESATCRYATSPGVAYASMGNAFTTTGGTAHSRVVTGLSNGSSYNYYVRCQDTAGNPNTDDFSIAFSVAQPSDTTPPVRSNGSPTGTLTAGTTQATISLTTNENAACRYATSPGVAYSSMNGFTTTGATSHSTLVTGLSNASGYAFYVRCQDTAGNPNTDDFSIAFSIAQPSDTTPPVRSNGSPTGTLTAGTTQATISLTTNENAACRYATSPGVAFAAMNAFATTGATTHSTLVTGLSNGTSYTFYVRCQDTAGNPNTDDFSIAFSIAQPSDTTSPVRSNGAPAGTLAAGTTQTTITMATNENATCRYSTSPGVAYLSMPSTFTTTGTTSHSTLITGLANGSNYTYYIRCQDSAGNANADDFTVAFSVGPVGPTGLVAAYSFNAGSGTSVADASGSGRTGTINGATWSDQGKYGNALSFNGTSNSVTVADAPALRLTTGMTLEAWVFPTSTTGTRDVIIKEGPSADYYNLYSRNWQGRPESNVFVAGNNRTAEGNVLAANVWTHLAGTYDGAVLHLYVNGVLAASTNAAGSIATSTGALRIGGNSLWGEYFQGRIDEVRIYNRALTQAEIQTDMNTPLTP